ncbi:tail fiber protein, partial [Vibrio parahaemolyticus]|nr:tail fiber protein [Vibrio parahaemolyticus]
DGTIIDERQVLMEFEPKLNAATNAEIDSRSSALKHIKLPQFWHALMGYAQSNHAHDDDYYLKAQVDSRLAGKVDKSSVTDSTSSTSSILVASAKAIKTVKDLAQSKWTYVTATVSRYGAVLLSNSYTGTSQTKAVTEKALRDGLATKSSSGHAHDEDYYLKAQLDSKLADKLSKTAKATLTDNDGHGNANLVGNHQGGIPQQDGSSYRVEMGTDTNVANLSIELGDSVRAGIAKALT